VLLGLSSSRAAAHPERVKRLLLAGVLAVLRAGAAVEPHSCRATTRGSTACCLLPTRPLQLAARRPLLDRHRRDRALRCAGWWLSRPARRCRFGRHRHWARLQVFAGGIRSTSTGSPWDPRPVQLQRRRCSAAWPNLSFVLRYTNAVVDAQWPIGLVSSSPAAQPHAGPGYTQCRPGAQDERPLPWVVFSIRLTSSARWAFSQSSATRPVKADQNYVVICSRCAGGLIDYGTIGSARPSGSAKKRFTARQARVRRRHIASRPG